MIGLVYIVANTIRTFQTFFPLFLFSPFWPFWRSGASSMWDMSITLASFFFKTLERIVQWELESNEMKNNPLHENQHAFQAGPSTDTAGSSMQDFVEEALSRKQIVLGAFIDIKGAFDNVDPDQAMNAIDKRGLPKWFTKWYRHYIKNRIISANFCGEKITTWIEKGCPQGGVLSPKNSLYWQNGAKNLALPSVQTRVSYKSFTMYRSTMISIHSTLEERSSM